MSSDFWLGVIIGTNGGVTLWLVAERLWRRWQVRKLTRNPCPTCRYIERLA